MQVRVDPAVLAEAGALGRPSPALQELEAEIVAGLRALGAGGEDPGIDAAASRAAATWARAGSGLRAQAQALSAGVVSASAAYSGSENRARGRFAGGERA